MRRAMKHMLVTICLCGMLVAASARAIWIDVPFVSQTREGCGAASLAMIMRYWYEQPGATVGQAADVADILQQLHSPQSHGIYASAMKEYLRDHGYQVFAFKGTWEDFHKHLAKGRPLIVALAPSRNEKVLHYIVVAGVDGDFVLFNDPADRKLARLDRGAFEKEWSASDNWTLLALPQPAGR